MADKAYFCFLLEWADMFNLLNEEQCGKLIKAMITYESDGIEPDFSDDKILQFAWLSNIKNKLDKLNEHYDGKRRQASEAGKASAERRRQNKQTSVNVGENERLSTSVENVERNEQTSTDSTNIDLDLNINLNQKEKINKKEKVRHKYGQYQNVLLSDEELTKLQTEFPLDYQERIENVSAYCASHGKTYKDYLATIRNWARRDGKTNSKNDPKAGYEQAMKLLGGNNG